MTKLIKRIFFGFVGLVIVLLSIVESLWVTAKSAFKLFK